MNITGKIRVFRKDFDNNIAYSTMLNNRDMNGILQHMYIAVQLPKGHELDNSTVIDVKSGFLSFFMDKKGYQHVKAIIMDYEIDAKEEPTDVTNEVYEQTMVNPDDELPF